MPSVVKSDELWHRPFLMKKWSNVSSWKQGRNPDFVFFFEKDAKKKGIVSFPTRPDWRRQMLQKNGQHSVPRQPPSEGGLRGYPAQAHRPGGGGKASEPPHSLEDSPVPCGPARSVIGGWWLLMTHQLSLEQSGTSSASLAHRSRTQSLPPQARFLGPMPGPVCPLG